MRFEQNAAEKLAQAKRKQRLAPENSIHWFVIDALCIIVSFLLAFVVLYPGEGFTSVSVALRHQVVAFTFLVCYLFFLWGFEMYSIVLIGPVPTFITVLLCGLYALIVDAVVYLVLFSQLEFLAFAGLGCLFTLVVMTLWRVALYFFHKHWAHRQKMLMIEKLKDDNSRVRRMKYACLSRFNSWYEQVDTSDMQKVQEFIDTRFPLFDVICLMESVPLEVRDMFLNAGIKMGKEFYIVPAMYELNFAKVHLALFDDVMVFHLLPNRISNINTFVKRFVDIALSALALMVAAIPMLIIALMIKTTSKGPVFYKQIRLTRDKKEFCIYKFRSMVQDAEAKTGPMLAVKDDPRITKVGKYLRMTRMDELPQLINILRGDMSVVGPRPERPFFVEQYEKYVDKYDERFLVRAGLTSLSHVHGRYSTDIEDRTRYDLLYIQNYSLLLDLKILLLTTRTIFLSDAAEGVSTVTFGSGGNNDAVSDVEGVEPENALADSPECEEQKEEETTL